MGGNFNWANWVNRPSIWCIIKAELSKIKTTVSFIASKTSNNWCGFAKVSESVINTVIPFLERRKPSLLIIVDFPEPAVPLNETNFCALFSVLSMEYL